MIVPGWRQAAAIATLSCSALTHAADASLPAQATVRTDDLDRFYRVYETTRGKPDAAALQAGYLDPGTPGLRLYLAARIRSAARLQQAIAASPQDYAGARQCIAPLAETKARLPAVFARLVELVPTARIAPVTFAIGLDNTGGDTTPDGVIIGVEKMCHATWVGADVATRFVHIVAHEMVHVQQPSAQVDAPNPTVLYQSLLEGGADLIGEMISGDGVNPQLRTWTRGRECAIEQAFRKDALSTDLSRWMYSGVGTADKPGDLGYWVGYRIAKAYIANASDKKQALADLLGVDNDNAAAFLARSGWAPQTGC